MGSLVLVAEVPSRLVLGVLSGKDEGEGRGAGRAEKRLFVQEGSFDLQNP